MTQVADRQVLRHLVTPADRVSRGAVVDFLNVGTGSPRTGIFNVADMAVIAGLVLTLLCRRGW
jgi:lipoprotein signal peptidase